MTIRTELLALKGDAEFLVVSEAEEWARNNPGSALYRSLEWNDTKAAREFRFHQIRRLVAIHITYDNGQRKMVSLSVDRSRDGGGYRNIDDVLKEQSLTEIMLNDALEELERVQRKYNNLAALKPIWEAIVETKRRSKTKAGTAKQRGVAA